MHHITRTPRESAGPRNARIMRHIMRRMTHGRAVEGVAASTPVVAPASPALAPLTPPVARATARARALCSHRASGPSAQHTCATPLPAPGRAGVARGRAAALMAAVD
jgi:hypothetical protein